MDDFRYTTHIGPEGDLHLHGVPLPSGQEVDVTIEVKTHKKGKIFNTSLAGIPVDYKDPFEPAVPPEDWDAINNASA
jgi:hypothetical protein